MRLNDMRFILAASLMVALWIISVAAALYAAATAP